MSSWWEVETSTTYVFAAKQVIKSLKRSNGDLIIPIKISKKIRIKVFAWKILIKVFKKLFKQFLTTDLP